MFTVAGGLILSVICDVAVSLTSGVLRIGTDAILRCVCCFGCCVLYFVAATLALLRGVFGTGSSVISALLRFFTVALVRGV